LRSEEAARLGNFAPSLEQPRSKSRWWIGLVVLGILGAGGYLGMTLLRQAAPKEGQPGTGERAAGRGTIPVIVASVRKEDLPLYLTGLGMVTAFNTASLRTRVDGEIQKVAFVEGQLIHEGDLLVEIDPRPFQVQLDQAEGQLAKDMALLQNSKLDLERYEQAKDAVAATLLSGQIALVAQYEGAVKTDQAAVASAKLNLTYSRITAPFTGRIGLRLVDVGNIVHVTDLNGLAVLTQNQPISVVFSLPADTIPQIQKAMKLSRDLSVEAFSKDLSRRIASGKLTAIDSQIDPTTSTVKLKATFENKDDALFPNQFVNARLLVDTLQGAVLIPSAAVQRGPQSTFVYVVKDQPSKADPKKIEKVVALREVVTGAAEGDDTSIVEGLAEGEIVVTDGVDKLIDGTKVSVPTKEAPTRPKRAP
jgi:multidrug efflux system membrane fusion protein